MKFPIPKDPSEYMLVAANCVPVAGVLWLGWDMFGVMGIYWMEVVILGVVNVMKMACVMVVRRQYDALLLIPFFCLHYGMFTEGLGLCVFGLFGHMRVGALLTWDDLVAIFAFPGFAFAFANLAAHHLYTFYFHFLRGGEVKKSDTGKLFYLPYINLSAMLAAAIMGGAVAMILHRPIGAMVLLMILKTVGDFILHQLEHPGAGQAATGKV